VKKLRARIREYLDDESFKYGATRGAFDALMFVYVFGLVAFVLSILKN
jgi:hypothetical protein